MGFSASVRMIDTSVGSAQPARTAAPRTAAVSARPESSRSTNSSRRRSRSATASDCSQTYPRAEAEESWSMNTKTASASAANASGSTPSSRAARDTCRQATRPPTW